MEQDLTVTRNLTDEQEHNKLVMAANRQAHACSVPGCETHPQKGMMLSIYRSLSGKPVCAIHYAFER